MPVVFNQLDPKGSGIRWRDSLATPVPRRHDKALVQYAIIANATSLRTGTTSLLRSNECFELDHATLLMVRQGSSKHRANVGGGHVEALDVENRRRRSTGAIGRYGAFEDTCHYLVGVLDVRCRQQVVERSEREAPADVGDDLVSASAKDGDIAEWRTRLRKCKVLCEFAPGELRRSMSSR